MLKTIKLSIFFGLFLLIFASANSTWAIEDSTTIDKSTIKNERAVEKINAANDIKEKVEATTAVKKANLSEARLRTCEAREQKIANRYKNLLTMGSRFHPYYDKIVARVDYFYTNNLVPNGLILENYDSLKADITSNKEAVSSALAQVQASGQEFSCDSDDPKGEADTFRTNMQALIASNKEYKTSVRAFVVAVRDLAKEAKAATLSITPEVSPVVTEGAVTE